MVGESVEPYAVASAAGTVAFFIGQEAAGSGVLGVVGSARPVDERVEVCPSIGDGADVEKLAEQWEGFGWIGARDVRRLGGVVCAESHGRGKRTELMFCSGEKNGETFSWTSGNLVQTVTCQAKGKDILDRRERMGDLFVNLGRKNVERHL